MSFYICNNNLTTLGKFIDSINELYVYIHSNDQTKQLENKTISEILLVLIIGLFVISLFKLVLIFLCFFLKWFLCDLSCLTFKLFKHKCTTFCKECSFNFNYFKKILKKIYTYNFYCYDKEIYGKFLTVLIPMIYMLFIIVNVLFCVMKIRNFNPVEIENESSFFQIILITILRILLIQFLD